LGHVYGVEPGALRSKYSSLTVTFWANLFGVIVYLSHQLVGMACQRGDLADGLGNMAGHLVFGNHFDCSRFLFVEQGI
jgi:hypothetical protein